MGRKTEDAKSALRVILANLEQLEQACYLNGGAVAHTAENEKLIRALEQNRLCYYDADSLCVQLKSAVKNFICFITDHPRFRRRHGHFADLLDDLEYEITRYLKSDAEFRLEKLHDVIEITHSIDAELFAAVSEYTALVANKFSFITDLQERIATVEAMVDEIEKINEIFAKITFDYLREHAKGDDHLIRVLCSEFYQSISRRLEQLVLTNSMAGRLAVSLHNEAQAYRLNYVVNYFVGAYSRDDGYKARLFVSDAAETPDFFRQARPLTVKGFAYLQGTYEDDLYESAEKALKRVENRLNPQPKTLEADGIQVTDGRTRQSEYEVDALTRALEYFIEAVDSLRFSELSARKAFYKLKPDGELSDFLMLVSGYYSVYRRSLENRHEVLYLTDSAAPYTGTRAVTDIVFRRKDGAALKS